MRRNDIKDLSVLVKKSCPQCNSTGFLKIPGGERTCPHCQGVPGVRVEEELTLTQFLCIVEQHKQDNALELSQGLREVYDGTGARLNPGKVRTPLNLK